MTINMQETLEKAKVILKAAVTWLTFAALVLTVVADELANVWSGDKSQAVISFLIRLAAWLGAAIAIIRRSTPVEEDERGVLPQG